MFGSRNVNGSTLTQDYSEPFTPQTTPPVQPPEQTTVQPSQRRTRTQRPSQRFTGRYERAKSIGGYVVAIIGCLGLWWLGAYLTLRWLGSMGIAVAVLGLFAYTIPLGVTLLEVAFLPTRVSSRYSRSFWLVVVTFDTYTSAAGVIIELSERFPVFSSWSQTYQWIFGAIIGLLLAFVPERAGTEFVRALKHEVQHA